MRHFSYDLPVTASSKDINSGIVNKGFHSDTDTNAPYEANETPASKTGESAIQNKGKNIANLDNDDSIDCGVCSFRPQILQGCKNMTCFTAVYCVIGLVTSGLSSYINSQITTIEKHFDLSSSMSGFIMSCNDMGYMAATLFMSYYARRLHIPRALTFCCLLYGISGITCAMGFFVTRSQMSSQATDNQHWRNLSQEISERLSLIQTCDNMSSSLNASCAADSTKSTGIFDMSDHLRTAGITIVAAGMILQGVAKSPRHAFLGTYVDDNVPKTKTSMYLGIMTGMSIFGPAIAYGLGGIFSNIYITLEDTSISPRDPRWLGAWWLGFLLFGGLGLIVGLPLICFPKRMRRQKELEIIKEKMAVDKQGKLKLWREFKGILQTIYRLLANPIFVCIVLANGLNYLAVSGMVSFLPKYMETQFTMTASKANILLGGVKLAAAPLGTIIGGYVTSRLKLSPIACLKVMIASKIIATAVSGLGLVIGCDQPVVLGSSQDGMTNLQCAGGCHCDDKDYFPVCGDDGNSYFSPCHAGCLYMNQMMFTNCTCMSASKTQTATGGLCVQDCNSLYPYIVMSFLGAFFATVIIMPGFIVIVRCVKEKDKPLAIGLNAFSGTLFGWFPGPILFGFLVDTTCKLWKTTCSAVGACTLYDIELFRFRFHALSLGLRSMTVALYITALVYSVCSKKTVFQPHKDEVSLSAVAEYNTENTDKTSGTPNVE